MIIRAAPISHYCSQCLFRRTTFSEWSRQNDYKYNKYTSAYHYACFFQSRQAAITFQLTPAIYLSKLKYVIRINSSTKTRPKDVQRENDNYKTDNVNVSYSGNYFHYTIKPYYVEL